MESIGLYGGTFAPPHLVHIHAVKSFLRHISVDKLYIMPTYQPPHKDKVAGDTPALRLEMCLAAFDGMPQVEVSSYEIEKKGVSYTVETLRHLTSPARHVYLLCGTDMYLTLDRWYMAKEIFSLAEIVCVSRQVGMEEQLHAQTLLYEKEYDGKCIVLQEAPLELSSTRVREAIAHGEELSPYVPPEVEKILRRENLYKGKIL